MADMDDAPSWFTERNSAIDPWRVSLTMGAVAISPLD